MALRALAAILVALGLCLAPALAQEAALRVGTLSAPPFAMRAEDGQWDGLAIALWQRVAGRLGVAYALRETSLDGMIDQVAAGALDLAVGPITVTPEREARVDFSHPYFDTSLGAAVAQHSWVGVAATLRALGSPEFLLTVGVFSALAFVVGALAWVAERRRNPGEFEPEAGRGLGSGFWWAVVTMSTVGYGDKTPVTVAGRILATLWMFVALILTAVFTAQLAANITAFRGDASLVTAAGLARLRVGYVEGAASLEPLRALGARPTGFAGVPEGLAALRAGEIDAFVHDAAMLAWEAARVEGVVIGGLRFDPQDYAFVLAPGSPLREEVNRALLEVLASPEWQAQARRWLGAGAGPDGALTRPAAGP